MKSYSTIFVLGANGSIGRELVKKLRQQYPSAKIYGSYNSSSNIKELKDSTQGLVQIDVTQEASWRNLRLYLKDLNIKFDLILSTVGTLEANSKGPEKSLRDINLTQLEDVFKINTFHSVLFAKEIKNYISDSENAKMIFLSAMVGSIAENDIGGWYSYRASKTALNMFIKGISIELSRKKLPIKVFAVHPGTTDTKLSEKFLQGVKHKIWKPSESAKNILDIIEEVNFESGSFFNWDGRRIEW